MHELCILLFTIILILFVTRLSSTNKTLSSDSCYCILEGHIYNLKSLARTDGHPRFITDFKDWYYGYNPCIPFSLKDHCLGVAICRWDKYHLSTSSLGMENKFTCQPFNSSVIELVYPIPESQQWNTRILLKCSPERTGIKDYIFKVVADSSSPVLLLEHKCCCPDACPEVQPFPSVKSDKKTNAYKWLAAGVAGSIGFLLLIPGIVYCWRRNRNRNRNNGENERVFQNRQVGYGGVGRHGSDDEASNSEDEILPHPVQVSGEEDNCSAEEEDCFPARSPNQPVENVHISV